MEQEIVRVFRIIEYVGTREWVEKTVSLSIQGQKVVDGNTIKAATLGMYPEILTGKDF